MYKIKLLQPISYRFPTYLKKVGSEHRQCAIGIPLFAAARRDATARGDFSCFPQLPALPLPLPYPGTDVIGPISSLSYLSTIYCITTHLFMGRYNFQISGKLVGKGLWLPKIKSLVR